MDDRDEEIEEGPRSRNRHQPRHATASATPSLLFPDCVSNDVSNVTRLVSVHLHAANGAISRVCIGEEGRGTYGSRAICVVNAPWMVMVPTPPTAALGDRGAFRREEQFPIDLGSAKHLRHRAAKGRQITYGSVSSGRKESTALEDMMTLPKQGESAVGLSRDIMDSGAP